MTTLFPFPPNLWAGPYEAAREYRTEIISSRSGKEQRRAMRNRPRRSVEYTATFTGDCLRDFNRAMHDAQRAERLIADRVRYHTLATTFANGANSLVIDPVPEWIEAGAELVLVSAATMAVRTVASVVGTTVTFDETNTFQWPVGSRLHAGMVGWVDPSIRAPNLLRRGVVQASIRFEEKPDTYIVEDAGTATTTLGGREVFLRRPDAWQSIDLDRRQDGAGSVDYGFGTVAKFFPVAFASRLWEANYTGCDAASVIELRQFFDRMKGQRGEFYMPTWQPDMVLTAGISSGGSTLTVQYVLDDETYSDSTTHKAVAIRKTTGDWLVNTVSSIANNGTDTVITVGTAWGETVATSAVDMVCWLPTWRFATDSLTFVWRRDTVAEVRMPFKMIETLAVETA